MNTLNQTHMIFLVNFANQLSKLTISFIYQVHLLILANYHLCDQALYS